MHFPIADLAKKAKSLSQVARLGQKDLLANAPAGAAGFTTTLACDMTADYLFEIGRGSIDPGQYARLFTQYALDNQLSVEELTTEFYDYIGAAARSQSTWRILAAFVTGSANRVIAADGLAQISPDILLTEIRKNQPASHDIFIYALTDMAVGILAPLGLVYNNATFAYRITRTPIYPDFRALVDCVAARQLKHVFTAFANVDVSTLKKMMQEKKKMNPSVLASTLQQAVLTAWDRTRGNYGARDVTIAVLSALGRSWDASLTGKAELPTRVRNASGFEALRSNLALFLAYQDMLCLAERSPGEATMSGIEFPDEEMASVIIPLFNEALAEVSPFKKRMVADCVSMVGMTTSRRHDGFPGRVVLFEDWAVSHEVIAFVPVRLSTSGRERFLDVDDGVTERMSMGMAPAIKTFGVPEFAASRRALYDLQHPHQRVPAGGTTITLGLPSIYEREFAAGRDDKDLEATLATGRVPDKGSATESAVVDGVEVTDQPISIRQRSLEWQAFSAYAHLVHLAVARHTNVQISPIVDGATTVMGARQLYLRWEIISEYAEGVGTSVVFDGSVIVTEPLEAIAYSADFSPSTKLEASAPNLRDFEGKVHIWDFHKTSRRVSYTAGYSTNIRNKPYLAQVTEKEILGFNASRPRLLAMRPPIARAIVAMWRKWFLEDIAVLREEARVSKDDVRNATYRGAEIEASLDVLARLIYIGSNGLGANVARAVENQLRDALRGRGYIDDQSDLSVGIQQASLQMFAGLVTLELLGLMDSKESAAITTLIRDSRAMTSYITTRGVVKH